MVAVDDVVDLRLYDIPFLHNEDDRENIIDSMFNAIKGFKYKYYQLESKYWFFEIGDLVKTVIDDKEEIIPIFGITTKHTGSAMTTIETTGNSYEEEKYNKAKISPIKKH